MYREILTKAIVAKGEKTIKNKETILTEDNVSKVLGCWIINHKYEITTSNDIVYISGEFDAFLWYGKNNNTDSNLIKKTFTYKDEIPYSFTIESYPLDEKCEIKSKIETEPSCISMSFDNNTINIEYISKVCIDIVGETNIKIKVDDIIVEEKINTNYMKDK